VVVKTLDRNGYRIENVMFESRPDFFVTGNLYVPKSGKGPFPAVISPCGHYPLARMQPDYQFVYLNLVKAGFVVLAYDPVGQGERRQYWNPRTGETEASLGPIFEHSMPGQQLLLLGEDLTGYRVWDGMRAIDYLLTRPEVDKQRIGCAGHSGGGTLTLFISALDERVRCAVVCEGGTGHRWPVPIPQGGRVGPSDVEQNLFPAAVHGIDLCDLHAAIAPRPLLALIEEYSPRFTLAADHIRERYRQLGVAEKFSTEEATDPHAYTVKLRQATTGWFSRWFYGRPGPADEPEFEPEPAPNLYCTPEGSLRYARKGKTIFTLIAEKQSLLPPARAWRRAELIEAIRRWIRFQPSGGSPDGRLRVVTSRKGYRVRKLEFLSEPGIYIPTWVFEPQNRNRESRAILYVNEGGTTGEGSPGMEFGVLERLARKGYLVVAIEVRGTGQTVPSHSQDVMESWQYRQLFDVETAAAYMAWFMDESLFGMRVLDVVRGVDYALGIDGVDSGGLHAIGVGRGALWVLYAAALDGRLKAVVCDRGLASYRHLTAADRYLYGADVFLPGVLREFDLPEVAGTVAGRRLTLLSPLDGMKRPLDAATAARTYQPTARAYAASNAADRFRIVERAGETGLAEQYLAALGMES
jgi:cephalosporin-C deacetylase-like acetyl esterase